MAKYLAQGEAVVRTARRHGLVLAGPLVAWLVLVAGAVGIGLLLSSRVSAQVVNWVSGIIGGAATLVFLWKIAQWRAHRYVLTDQRVLMIEGIFYRKVSAIPLSKVTDTTYSRSPVGRLLGYGEIVLETAGERADQERLSMVPHPDEVYRQITALTLQRSGSIAPPAEKPRRDDDDTGPLPATR